jgi:hypothetical protein
MNMKKGYMGGGMMKRRYAGGGDIKEGMDSPGMGISKRDKRALELPQDPPAGFRPMVPDDEMEKKNKTYPPKPPQRKKTKPKKSYKYGGKVRGCGAISKKLRPAKMVKMKGA